VTVDGEQLTVVTAPAPRFPANRRGSQVQSRLGADLPLNSLRYWMTARPDPAGESTVQDSTTPPLRVIEQNGWRVAYDEFGRFDGRVAPTRLTATGANVRLKLVLDRWAVAGPPNTGSP
jgi:outer membrane biogenesis lipoprotein LolB